MITKKQKEVIAKYVSELQEIQYKYSEDNEAIHSYADEALLSAMIELGFQEIANEYMKCEEFGFWYA